MELYYIIFSLLLFCTIFEFATTRTKHLILMGWCIFFVCFGGLRWEIGGDWLQYYEIFKDSSWTNIFSFVRSDGGSLECGFVLINVVLKGLLSEFYVYNIVVCAFIQFTCYKFCIRISPRYPLLLYAFIMINASNYFPVRSGLSIAIAYWAYHYIQQQRFKPFLAIVAAASSVHYQCLVLLPFYWVGRFKLTFLTLSILYFIFALFSYVFQDYFMLLAMLMGGDIGEKAFHYTQFQTEGHDKVYAGWLLNYLFLLLYLYYRRLSHKANDIWTNALIVMSLVHSAIFMVFSETMGDLTRLADLFLPAKSILFVLSLIFLSKQKNRIIQYGAIVILIGYMAYRVTKIGDWYYFLDCNVPYKTIFDYNIL